jgi:oligoendopeptidase F
MYDEIRRLGRWRIEMKKFYIEEIPLNQVEQIKSTFDELLHKEVNSAVELEDWLKEKSSVLEMIDEALTGHYIAFQCDNNDEEAKKLFEHDQEVILPMLKKYQAQFDEKYLNSPYRRNLDQDYYKQFDISKKNANELFREENISLEVDEDRLATKYFEVTGSLTVDWEGQEKTLSQMSVFMKDSDRKVREKAWKLVDEALHSCKSELGDIMSQLIKIREVKANNANVANYRDYMFKKYERFSYTPNDCYELAEAIKKHVVPLKEEIEKTHQSKLGLNDYRPWDLQAVPKGQTPLKPFDTAQELIDGTESILHKLDPEFASLIKEMNERGMLDLDNRKGKSPGGFCSSLPVSELSFIFMNSTGNQRDLITLVHEMGHCIHNMYKNDIDLAEYKDTPMESAELASMTMELFTMHLWGHFYKNEEDLNRAKKEQLEGIIKFLPGGIVIDQFQHWMYENPQHTEKERNDKFLELAQQLSATYADYSGFEQSLAIRWMMTLHIFEVPFYYIEYVIAQLGALQMYKQFKKDPKLAIENYKNALSLGKSKSLTEVYEEAGIKFDFSEEMVKELMEFVKTELAELQ